MVLLDPILKFELPTQAIRCGHNWTRSPIFGPTPDLTGFL
jgi:hypothetical protein